MRHGIGAYRHLTILWALVFCVDGYVLFDSWRSRAIAADQGGTLAMSYVRLVEEHASASFDRTNILLRQAVALMSPADLHGLAAMPEARRRAIEAALIELQQDGRGIVSMSMTDRDGKVFANTVGTPPGRSLGDRDYFLALRQRNSSEPVVSRAIKGRVSNKWGIQVARSFRGPDGRFAGMVVANMGLSEYFEPFYQSLLLTNGAVISLRDFEHRVVVRYPAIEHFTDQPIPAAEVALFFTNGIAEGRYHRISPVDGVAREVAFRKLSNYPLYAVVALAERDVLANWRMGFDRAVIFVVLVTLGTALASVTLLRKAQLERQVRENAEKLTLALKAAHAATWYWNPSSNRLQWSAEPMEVFGTEAPPESLAQWLEQLHPDDRDMLSKKIDRLLMVRDTVFRAEFRVLGREGREHWMAAIGTMSYDRDGRPEGAFGVNIDISAAKLAEVMLEMARDEALEAKAEAERASLARSQFLAAASHDLRQPVQSLLLLIEVVKIRLAGTPMERVTVQMEQSLDALRLLLDSLLDVSKLDAGVVIPVPTEVELGRLLGRLAEEYQIRAAQKGLELRVVDSSVRLRTDPALLERILRNLIENAMRYTERGRVLVGCRHFGGTLRIDVVDTGIGIAPADHEVIFDEFHQVGNSSRDRSQGLGLGLAIVRRLATLLGGRVELHSALGHGARFSLLLPLRQPW